MKWEPFQWLDLKGRKRFVIFAGVILLWNFVALVMDALFFEKGVKLSTYLYTLGAAAFFGWSLYGLKLGFDKEKRKKDNPQEEGEEE